MFSANKKAAVPVAGAIDTFIGDNAVIEDTLRTFGTTRIDGRVIGESVSQGVLIVGDSGYLEGDVKADSVLIAGTVKGNLYVSDKLEITESGKVIGDVHTKRLIIAEGAAFEGKCVMTDEKAKQPMNTVNAANAAADKKVNSSQDEDKKK